MNLPFSPKVNNLPPPEQKFNNQNFNNNLVDNDDSDQAQYETRVRCYSKEAARIRQGQPSPTLTPKILSSKEVQEISSQNMNNSLCRDRSRDEKEIQAKKEYIEEVAKFDRIMSQRKESLERIKRAEQ